MAISGQLMDVKFGGGLLGAILRLGRQKLHQVTGK
jgi:hypothetical protein